MRRAPREVIRGTEEERNTTCCIFIGNLPYSFEERDIVNLFERFGRLRSVSVPMDRYTRRNRGFAFLEYEQRTDAEDAFNKYNGYEIEGRKLRLDWDVGRPSKDTARGIDRNIEIYSPSHNCLGRRSPPRDRSPRGRSPVRSPRGRSPMRDRSPIRERSPPRRDYERADEYR
jgi:RNA recognition motif-containing protein